MGRETNIAWTKSTLNLAWGCTKVSRECTQCYMYRLSERFGKDPYTVDISRRADLYGPHEGQKYKDYVWARVKGMRELVFVNSMSDTFHKDIADSYLDIWFDIFSQFPEKQFQILTKRPERAAEYFRIRPVPGNCWIGTSVGIREALPRIDVLRSIPAHIRFISFEPLLEDVDDGSLNLQDIQWVIIGGESDDTSPRPMEPEWAENIVEEARAFGCKIFFKQMGGKGGDGAGGDLINGRKIQEMPFWA